MYLLNKATIKNIDINIVNVTLSCTFFAQECIAIESISFELKNELISIKSLDFYSNCILLFLVKIHFSYHL